MTNLKTGRSKPEWWWTQRWGSSETESELLELLLLIRLVLEMESSEAGKSRMRVWLIWES